MTSDDRPLGARPALPEEAARYVRDLILSGQVRAGEYLRIERLAEALRISPTPVREALVSLKGEGLIEQEPRRGFRVAPLAADDISDVFLAQSWVAGELAARAAGQFSEANGRALSDLQDQIEQHHDARRYDRVEQLNFEFHREINHVAASSKLAWFLKSTTQYAPVRSYGSIAGWTQASVDDHREIIVCLLAADREGAREAMAKHVRNAGGLLVEHLKDMDFWSGSSPDARGLLSAEAGLAGRARVTSSGARPSQAASPNETVPGSEAVSR